MTDSAVTSQDVSHRAAPPPPARKMTVPEVEAELERLAGLSKYAYEREQEAAAKSLSMSVGDLNSLVWDIQKDWKSSGNDWRVAGTTAASRKSDAGIVREWPYPVTASDLLPQLVGAIHRHIVISDDAALTTALWIMHCHALDAFETSPRLIIASGEPASGKSTLLDLLGQMVPRPLTFSAATAAAVVKGMAQKPVLLMDDGGAVLASGGELRNILRAGRRRNAAQVLRLENGQATGVSVWAPAALCVTGRLPALSGHSIEIRLQRAAPAEAALRLRSAGNTALAELSRKAARWASDHTQSLRRAEHAIEFSEDENWTPLLVIAQSAGEEWQQRAGAAMRVLRAEAAPSVLETLLTDIRTILGRRETGQPILSIENGRWLIDRDRIRSTDLARILSEIEGGLWHEWGQAKQPLTPHALAKLLAPLRIRPATLRFHTSDQNGVMRDLTDKGYLHAQFTDAFARYLPELSTEGAAP
ncbi:MAG TPA: DUF3631 domain-containing protein [Micropepsaceae bacterium]|nr:DUF3631 domain-containing protein [Micropepsaceae bacterium]